MDSRQEWTIAKSRAGGFTLLELLAAITIVATISAIAIPIYTQYTERSFRTIGQSDLLSCAQAMERFGAVNFTYAGAADTDDDGAGDADAGTIATDICDPESAELDRYDITVVGDVNTYTLTATPTDEGPMADDGFMTIDHLGNREWDKDDNGAIEAGEDDWRE